MNLIKLIVGLGNPGREYENTRHNAGAWLVQALASSFGAVLNLETKFQGVMTRVQKENLDLRLLIPVTYMNLSGRSIQSVASFYKIQPSEILVIHDEIDLPVGQIRLKKGGGDGGQKGVRDTIAQLGPDFWRLRIGVGHPGVGRDVASYVLNIPPKAERDQINEVIQSVLQDMNLILEGNTDRFMNKNHQIKH